MSDIVLDYRVPAPEVADYVTLFYNFHANVPMFEDMERADYAQLRFRTSGGFAFYEFPDGRVIETGAIHITGPTSGAMKCRAEGPLHLFGAGITPAGWAALFGGDASDMLDSAMNAEGAMLARMEITMAAIRATDDMDVMVAAISELILEMACKAGRESVEFARQVDAWLESDPSPDIDDLIAATRLSRRQVERKCNALYGAPPKLLARKYRALRAAVAMRAGELNFDAAVGMGFYDQSHLIREVKQFTGLTPKQIRDRPTALAELTVTERTRLAGLVTPLISNT